MKIKRLHTIHVLQSTKITHTSSFDSDKYNIEYVSGEGCIIDNHTFVPINNIREMVIEPDVTDTGPKKLKVVKLKEVA